MDFNHLEFSFLWDEVERLSLERKVLRITTADLPGRGIFSVIISWILLANLRAICMEGAAAVPAGTRFGEHLR